MNSRSYLFKQLQKGKKLISSSSISRLLWVRDMLGLNQMELLSAFILEILGGEKNYYVAEADHQDTMDNAGPLKVRKSPHKKDVCFWRNSLRVPPSPTTTFSHINVSEGHLR